MKLALAIFYSITAFFFVFGSPLIHVYRLFGGSFAERFKDPDAYEALACGHLANLIFAITVIAWFWWQLKDEGSGSFNGIMALPFLVIYFVAQVLINKKIDGLEKV